MEKIIGNIEQLEMILNEESCLLYGAGKVSRIIIKYASKHGYTIERILVSDMVGNPSEIMGISVCTMEDYQEDIGKKCLIVSVMETLHEFIRKEISDFNFKNKYFVSDMLIEQIKYKIGDYEVEQLYKLRNVEKTILAQKESLLRFVPRPCLEYIVLNIVDHCNLRCKGCDHFACIADPYYVNYETIHQDLERLSELFHQDYIMKIAVMGGEPLLHPDLLEILKDVRKHFPYTIIRLTTNGILLLKQKDEFWRVCRENDITIVNTKYPINLDFKAMEKKAESEKVKFQYFEETGEHLVKKSFKKIINLKGDSNPVESFANCHISNYGNFLMEGKIYSCPFSCQSFRIFNKKFNQNLRMTEKDYIDIYKVKDMQEILDFASKPKFYCRYCSGLSPLFEWTRSKQEISEWIE